MRLYVRRLTRRSCLLFLSKQRFWSPAASAASVMTHQQLNEQLPGVIEGLVGSLGGEPGLAHLNRVYLPSKETIIESIKRLRQLVFPGYFGEQGLTPSNISYRIGELVLEVSEMLYQQVRCCLRYSQQIPGANGNGENCFCLSTSTSRCPRLSWACVALSRSLPN